MAHGQIEVEAAPVQYRTYTVHKIAPRAWHYRPGDTIRLFDDHRDHVIVKSIWTGKHWLLNSDVIISKDTLINISPLPWDDWWRQLHED